MYLLVVTVQKRRVCVQTGTGFTIIRKDFGWNDLRTAIAYQCVISRRRESRRRICQERKMKSPPLKNAQSLPGSLIRNNCTFKNAT